MRYFRSLDTVRAFAVFLVIISHWVPKTHFINALPNGVLGVDIFFVLSGFLISSILFGQRTAAAKAGRPVIKNFYVRRSLRIFPIYYLTIVLLLLFERWGNANISGSFVYLATYTSNIYFFRLGTWDGIISHLWSLAVEEQFYLIWPWVALFVPRRALPLTIAGFILVGIASQILLQDYSKYYVLVFTCFDAFGLGAVLAWLLHFRPHRLTQYFRWLSGIAVVALVLAILNLYFGIHTLPLRTSLSLMALWLISYLVIHQGNLRARIIFENSPLVYLGRISYGLYLYHIPIPLLLNRPLVDKYLNPLLPQYITTNYYGALTILENGIMLLVISMLSYELIEKRCLHLKRYFTYTIKGATAQPAPATTIKVVTTKADLEA